MNIYFLSAKKLLAESTIQCNNLLGASLKFSCTYINMNKFWILLALWEFFVYFIFNSQVFIK